MLQDLVLRAHFRFSYVSESYNKGLGFRDPLRSTEETLGG